MFQMLTFDGLVSKLHQRLEQLTEYRQGGNNTRYELKDTALSAMAVFFTQSPSFLAHQKKLAKPGELQPYDGVIPSKRNISSSAADYLFFLIQAWQSARFVLS